MQMFCVVGVVEEARGVALHLHFGLRVGKDAEKPPGTTRNHT